MSHSSSEEGSAENPEQPEEAKEANEQPAEEQEGKAEQEHQQETFTIHIGNLKYEANEDDLREAFTEFGEIKSVRIPQDDRGRSRGYGFVEYATKEAADAAIEKMNESEFKGRDIKVSIADNHGQRNFGDRDRRGGDRRGGRGGRYNDRDRGDRRRDHGGDRRDRGDRGDRYGRGRQY